MMERRSSEQRDEARVAWHGERNIGGKPAAKTNARSMKNIRFGMADDIAPAMDRGGQG